MRSGRPHVILIDGESGAGKTTLSEVMAEALTATVVHLDDTYPGWEGLEAGRDAIIATVLSPALHGAPASYVPWDWNRSEPRDLVPVHIGDVLIVEGCGISTHQSRAMADVVIWVDCPAEIRRERLRRRDGAQFDAHTERWDEQVARHVATHDPIATATVRLNG